MAPIQVCSERNPQENGTNSGMFREKGPKENGTNSGMF
jgi:hypothetical protein